MTEIQEHLLKYIKEIDKLCRENDIEYFLDGGTLIGAIRHDGFLPWDDDLDIFMPRANWEKFMQLFLDGKFPENRCLTSYEIDRKYPNVFGRYTDTSVTAIHSNQLFDTQPAGMPVDIFPMDPIPEDPVLRRQYTEDLQLFTELHNMRGQYSIRFCCNRDRYAKAMQMLEEGRDGELYEELKQRMFQYKEEECGSGVIRWAGIAFYCDKSYYDHHIDVKFEDAVLMAPCEPEKYLALHYGPDWYQVPKVTERQTHNAIYNFKKDYKTMREQYFDGKYDKEQMRKYMVNTRNVRHANMDLIHDRQDEIIRIRSAAMAARVKKNIARSEISVKELMDTGRYAEVLEIFQPFVDYASSRECVGREDFFGMYRLENPILADLGQENFEIVIQAMIYGGYMSKVIRLLNAYRLKGGEMTPPLAWAQKFLDDVADADIHFWKKEYDQAAPLVETLLKDHPDNQHLLYMNIYMKVQSREHPKDTRELLRKAQTLYPENGELMKCAGDLDIQEGRIMEGLMNYYRSSLYSNNGLDHLDNRHWIKDHVDEILAALEGGLASVDPSQTEEFLEYICERSYYDNRLVAAKYQLLTGMTEEPAKLLSLGREMLKEPVLSNPERPALRAAVLLKCGVALSELSWFASYDNAVADNTLEDFVEKISREIDENPHETEEKALLLGLRGDAKVRLHDVKTAFEDYRAARDLASDGSYIMAAADEVFRIERQKIKEDISFGRYPGHVLEEAYEIRFGEKLSCKEILEKN